MQNVPNQLIISCLFGCFETNYYCNFAKNCWIQANFITGNARNYGNYFNLSTQFIHFDSSIVLCYWYLERSYTQLPDPSNYTISGEYSQMSQIRGDLRGIWGKFEATQNTIPAHTHPGTLNSQTLPKLAAQNRTFYFKIKCFTRKHGLFSALHLHFKPDFAPKN